jgi:hypothetical protein
VLLKVAFPPVEKPVVSYDEEAMLIEPLPNEKPPELLYEFPFSDLLSLNSKTLLQ